MIAQHRDWKYSILGFGIILFVSIGGFTVFNYAQDQYDKYQARQTEQYRRTVSGMELFGFQSATVGKDQDNKVKTDWLINQDIPMEFCREPLARIVAKRNFRTFFLLENGAEKQSGERRLPDDISYQRTEDPCQDLGLLGKNTPKEAGKYKFCQEFEFDYFDYPKDVRFCSSEFNIIER